ncbi:MAG: hypothetical protein SH821_05630 [Phototrophicales bacterium]|nr:hypothetical protein [Phototrophicales bacterium]
MDNLHRLEEIAHELIESFDIHAPPVPIETMLQHPKSGMWDEVDVNQLSGTFLSIKDQYSPRMSLARLLARHVATSTWGKERGVFDMVKKDEELLRAFARMIIMPATMVRGLTASARNSMSLSTEFEAPEEDARQRLLELFK